MGFRFRRSVRLFPGVRLNVSGKSGLSASFGTRGAWLTVGRRGTRATMGIPGTGISYTRTTSSSSLHRLEPPASAVTPEQAADAEQRSQIRGWIWIALIVAGLIWFVWTVAARL